MAGIYSINIDGTGEVQITSSGMYPSWQGVPGLETTDPINSITTPPQANSPSAPNTGLKSVEVYSVIVPILLAVAFISVAIFLNKKRRNT